MKKYVYSEVTLDILEEIKGQLEAGYNKEDIAEYVNNVMLKIENGEWGVEE